MKKFALFLAACALVTVSMLGTPHAASAESTGADSTVPGKLDVVRIFSADSGVYVVFLGNPFPSTTCGTGSTAQNMWKISGTDANVGRILSLLTAAKLSGTKVNIGRPDSGTMCSGGATGYPLLINVMLG